MKCVSFEQQTHSDAHDDLLALASSAWTYLFRHLTGDKVPVTLHFFSFRSSPCDSGSSTRRRTPHEPLISLIASSNPPRAPSIVASDTQYAIRK